METPRICFTLQQALNTKLPNCFTTFIVQNEDHKFLVFKSVQDYLDKRELYDDCHEVVIFKDEKAKGRLVFDFDYKYENMTSDFPPTFCSEIENTIRLVFKKYYTVFPTMKFVWLRCENKKKISFHLIVKGAYFVDDWKVQMNDFYTLMLDEMKNNEVFNFYNDTYLDKGIARNNATLRMPYNSKKNGNPLIPYFEGNEEPFDFYDGLIGVYRNEDKTSETQIHKNHLIVKHEDKEYEYEEIDFRPEDVYRQFQTMNDGVFKLGTVDKNFITLLRKKPSNCLLDPSRFHESDNSYLIVNKFGIYFGCHRGCTHLGKKLMLVTAFEKSPVKVSQIETEPIKNCEAFELAHEKLRIGKWFVQGKVGEKFIQLKRINSCKNCPVSKEPHEDGDAYLVLNNNNVSFGCSKNCTYVDENTGITKKTKFVGKLQ